MKSDSKWVVSSDESLLQLGSFNLNLWCFFCDDDRWVSVKCFKMPGSGTEVVGGYSQFTVGNLLHMPWVDPFCLSFFHDQKWHHIQCVFWVLRVFTNSSPSSGSENFSFWTQNSLSSFRSYLLGTKTGNPAPASVKAKTPRLELPKVGFRFLWFCSKTGEQLVALAWFSHKMACVKTTGPWSSIWSSSSHWSRARSSATWCCQSKYGAGTVTNWVIGLSNFGPLGLRKWENNI